jgi:hypothetical protein
MTRLTITRRTRGVMAGACAIAVVALAGIGSGAGAGSPASPAARLVAAMRTATAQTDFSGVVTVTWRNVHGHQEHATVDVRAANGVLEVTADGQVVLDDGGHTFLKDDLGWTSPVSEPSPQHRPSPDARWRLAVNHGTSHDRDVSTVVATRRDGTVAARLVIDDATHLPLARQVLDDHGAVLRSYEFVSLDLAAGAATPAAAIPNATSYTATAIDHVPSGYHAPDVAGAGYTLLSRSRHNDGVHLVYSDGLFTASVTEQRGELDWAAMPSGGTTTDVDGVRARRYVKASGDVLVWERDGVVYTCVSDAPTDVLASMAAGLTPHRGAAAEVADFVLGPFAFD